jgi:polyphosphate glucokinase
MLTQPGSRGAARRWKVLVIDVGGTHVKLLASGHRVPREIPSGPSMTAREMVSAVEQLAADWRYDVVSIGYPGVVIHGRPVAEPHNLGRGWVGFDFRRAFGRPVKLVNDAVMQALGLSWPRHGTRVGDDHRRRARAHGAGASPV